MVDGPEIDDELEDTLIDMVNLLLKIEPDRDLFFRTITKHLNQGLFEFFEVMEFPSAKDKRMLASQFAIMVWNHSPLPSNNYQPILEPILDKNTPCVCESGKPFKQCCGLILLSEMLPITTEMLTTYVLDEVSDSALKQAWHHLPPPLLGEIALAWCQEMDPDQAERVLLMLNPLFKQDEAKIDASYESAFDAIIDACSMLNKSRKKSALIKRMMRHPDQRLRANAMHRQCCVLTDQGDIKQAWVCFQEAQRIEPDNVGLSHLELLMLLSENKSEQATMRAAYWIKRIQGMNPDGQYDHLLAWIQQVADDQRGIVI
ncbi:MAG: SEC-C metal-binding domain-containing protein [Mariprofundales bacterium]|nr:SEC-C metal-binding domain-containing protein [Mariprofundales bacterium]